MSTLPKKTEPSLADHGTSATSAGVEGPKTVIEAAPTGDSGVVPPVPHPDAMDTRRVSTVERLAHNDQFSIDELRVIAAALGVPDRAQLTESADLVAAIRERI